MNKLLKICREIEKMKEKEFFEEHSEYSEYLLRRRDEDLVEKIDEIHAFFIKIWETQISILKRLEHLEKNL